MVDLVNMDADSDLDSQFDSDDSEEELEEFEEDMMLLVVAAVADLVFLAAVCGVAICFRFHNIPFAWHEVVWPNCIKTARSIISPTSDNDVPRTRQKAHWTTSEEAVLIQFLFERKNEMTWRTMFNYRVFRQAAKAVNRFHEKGARKTSISSRSKWTRVCTAFLFVRVFNL
jgi:hypothetical protein